MGKCVAAAGFIYLHFLFRTVGFCFSKILHLRRSSHHKIRLSYCLRKAFAATLCHVAEYAANSFPASAGSKGINTLDFPTENRVPTGMLAPLLET